MFVKAARGLFEDHSIMGTAGKFVFFGGKANGFNWKVCEKECMKETWLHWKRRNEKKKSNFMPSDVQKMDFKRYGCIPAALWLLV